MQQRWLKAARYSAVLAGLTVAGVLAGTPAWAACPAGYHCVYRDNIDDNQYRNYFNNDSNFTDDTFTNGGGSVNDSVSAARNSSTGNFRSRYWYNTGYQNIVFCVNPGSSVSGLGGDGVAGNGVGRNDEASSLDLASGFLSGCF